MEKLWIDLETFSEVPINNGTHAYAEKVEVMLMAWAIDDRPVRVWDLTAGTVMPPMLYQALGDPAGTVVKPLHHPADSGRRLLVHIAGLV